MLLSLILSGAVSTLCAKPDDEVLARVDGLPITAAEVDALIRMPLHELDLARHELRTKALQRLIAARLKADSAAEASGHRVEMLLERPLPPRFELAHGDNPMRGNEAAPVTLVEFMDFQSPHCKRVWPVLHRLVEDYQPLVRLVVMDLPLPIHRQAWQAAEAAACAAEQDAYWPYHERLLQDQDDLGPERLLDLASSLKMDVATFKTCLAAEATRTRIREDEATARQLGVTSTPTFFINGLYLKGARDYADFARLINRELVRLGMLGEEIFSSLGWDQNPFLTAAPSALPMTLSGTQVVDDPAKSAAILFDEATRTTHTLTPGQSLQTGFRLVLVLPDRIYLQNGPALEYLTLNASHSGGRGSAAAAAPGAARSSPPDAVVTLKRNEIEAALADSAELTRVLEPGSLDIGGKRLLKLSEVTPGGLFDRLGLQPRDVLMQVNGQRIFDTDNPLWESLATGDRVDLLIMRRGFPKRFQYDIRD